MKYKKVRKCKLRFKLKATEVLYDKMMFYHTKAEDIANFLIEVIEAGKMARGDLLAQIHKDMHRFNDIVIECASKLAPYQSPKLETIEVKQKVTHRFVVAAPRIIEDSNKWLESTAINPNIARNNNFKTNIIDGHVDIDYHKSQVLLE